ncbi:ribonuclease H-like domain-containing protein [Mrakia frigida]|uniref:ribonuclease H family protein n=1 Tax=Mrakia frigida TaxID=29902 RepID=UPI003FCC0F74
MSQALLPSLRLQNRRFLTLSILQTLSCSRETSTSLLSRVSISQTKLNKPPPSLTSFFSTTSLIMAKPKAGFYAVKVGKKPGIYMTWDECVAQVKGHPGALYQKFSTAAEAQQFAFPGSSAPPPPSAPASSSTSSNASPSTSSTSSRASPSTLKRPSSSASSSASAKKKAKGESSWSHTASSVTPSTFDAKDRFWKTNTGRIVVYTDGSALGNGKVSSKAGAGVFWGAGNERNVSERVPGSIQTNNRGELLAIIRAIETAPDSKTPLEIRTDSQYSIKCLTEWLPNWRRKGFKNSTGGGVVNIDLIKHLATLIDLRRGSTSSIHSTSLPSKKFDSDSEGEEAGPVDFILEVDGEGKGKRTGGIKFVHVKAHVGLEGNEAADTLANQGALLPPAKDRLFGPTHAILPSVSSTRSVVVAKSTAVKKGTTTTTKRTTSEKKLESSHPEGDEEYDLDDSEFWGDAVKATEEVEAQVGSSQPRR